MTKEEWNEGLNHLDPDLVEQYVAQKDRLRKKSKKSKSLWIRFGAIAACFLLILSAAIVMPMLWADDPGIVPQPNNNHTPIILDALASAEKLTGSNSEFIVGSSSAVDSGVSSSPPAFQFSSGIAVKARVVKNYPDKYYNLDTNPEYKPTAYRLIQMETLAVISGENVPQYFLYLIPEYRYVDMSVYDSLLISMVQRGAENYILKNETQSQIEVLALPVFADRENHPELGNIIAFSDGIFDESLWQNKSWRYGYQFAKNDLDNPQRSDLVVARGSSEREVIAAIKKQYGANHKARTVITFNFKTQEAKDAMEYVKPFANGVFSQCLEPYYIVPNCVVFRRYINGCWTEETVTIDLLTEEVTYSQVRYTKEELMQIENISVHLAEKAADYKQQHPTPPHMDPEGKELLCLHLYGWYVKVDGKLYGVIKTAWRYHEEDDYYLQYYDEAFVLYDMSAGTAADVSREDLVPIVGAINLYMGEYGTGIELPSC